MHNHWAHPQVVFASWRCVLPTLEARAQVLEAIACAGATHGVHRPGERGPTATLAWYDDGGKIVEGEIDDVGALRERLQPACSRWLCRPGPALFVRPFAVDAVIEVSLRTDLWLPWVFDLGTTDGGHRHLRDNRALASRHTPRLNAFLAETSEATGAAGGSFALDPYETGPKVLPMLRQAAVDLRWTPPSSG